MFEKFTLSIFQKKKKEKNDSSVSSGFPLEEDTNHNSFVSGGFKRENESSSSFSRMSPGFPLEEVVEEVAVELIEAEEEEEEMEEKTNIFESHIDHAEKFEVYIHRFLVKMRVKYLLYGIKKVLFYTMRRIDL